MNDTKVQSGTTPASFARLLNGLLRNRGGHDLEFGRFWVENDGQTAAGDKRFVLGYSDNRPAALERYCDLAAWADGVLKAAGFKTRRQYVDGYFWVKFWAVTS